MDESVEYEEGLSNCCGARVYQDMGICADCKEHCDLITEEE